MKKEDVSDILGKAYENFLMRDVVFVAGGSLVMLCCARVTGVGLVAFVGFVTTNIYRFILFLGGAYFIGLIAQEGGLFVGKERRRMEHGTTDGMKSVVLSQIASAYGTGPFLAYERVQYFEIMGTTIAASAAIGAVVWVFGFVRDVRAETWAGSRIGVDIAGLVALLAVFVVCFLEYKFKRKLGERMFKEFKDEVDKLKAGGRSPLSSGAAP